MPRREQVEAQEEGGDTAALVSDFIFQSFLSFTLRRSNAPQANDGFDPSLSLPLLFSLVYPERMRCSLTLESSRTSEGKEVTRVRMGAIRGLDYICWLFAAGSPFHVHDYIYQCTLEDTLCVDPSTGSPLEMCACLCLLVLLIVSDLYRSPPFLLCSLHLHSSSSFSSPTFSLSHYSLVHLERSFFPRFNNSHHTHTYTQAA